MSSPTIRLIAEAVERFGDDSVYSLGLAEHRDDVEEGFALIFSAAEPDREGSGYSEVAEPGQRTAYGGIASCELGDGVLRIQLTEAAAIELELPPAFSLDLSVESGELALLERGLRRVGVPLAKPA